jgi:glutathione S-transferase
VSAAKRGGVTIYSSPTCGWAVRNYAALAEKGVAFEVIDVKRADFATTAAWRASSPYGKTPSLVHGEVAVWESQVINEYLEQAFPEPALTPVSPEERALARLWIWHCDGVLFPLVYKLSGAQEEADRLAAAKALAEGIAALEHPAFGHERLSPFWGGARLGLVDIAYQVLFETLDRVEDWARTPVAAPAWFQAWSAAVDAAPSIQRAKAVVADLRRAAE